MLVRPRSRSRVYSRSLILSPTVRVRCSAGGDPTANDPTGARMENLTRNVDPFPQLTAARRIDFEFVQDGRLAEPGERLDHSLRLDRIGARVVVVGAVVEQQRGVDLVGLEERRHLHVEYPFESHTPRAIENNLDMWARWIDWFDRFVKGEGDPKPAATPQ